MQCKTIAIDAHIELTNIKDSFLLFTLFCSMKHDTLMPYIGAVSGLLSHDIRMLFPYTIGIM